MTSGRSPNKFLFSLLAVSAMLLVFVQLRAASEDYGLKLISEYRQLEWEGKSYEFRLFRYGPPYVIRKSDRTLADSDTSTPEGVVRAFRSSIGRDIDWFWSLYDENTLPKVRQAIQEAAPDYFDGWDASKPPVHNWTNPAGISEEFLYKIEFEQSGVTYAMIVAQVVSGNERHNIIDKRFSKKNGIWFLTQDIDDHPLADIADRMDYDEFINFLKTGDLFPKLAPAIQGELRTSKNVYELGEPVEFTLTLKNVSAKPVKIFAEFSKIGPCYTISLQKDGYYDFIGVPPMTWDPKPEEFVVLSPGQEVSASHILSNYELSNTGEIDSVKTEGGEKFSLPEGEISATAQYVAPLSLITGSDKLADLFTGMVQTKPVSFQMKRTASEAVGPARVAVAGEQGLEAV